MLKKQKEKPIKGDWIETVLKDVKQLDIIEEDIENMTSLQLRRKVIENSNKITVTEMNEKKKSMSKTRRLGVVGSRSVK